MHIEFNDLNPKDEKKSEPQRTSEARLSSGAAWLILGGIVLLAIGVPLLKSLF